MKQISAIVTLFFLVSSNLLCETKRLKTDIPQGSFKKPLLSDPIRIISLPNYHSDFIIIEHFESKKKFLLGGREDSCDLIVSSPEMRDTYDFLPDSKVVAPADINRKVGDVHFNYVDDLVLTVNRKMDCRLQQVNYRGTQILHMVCVTKRKPDSSLEAPTHNFFIYPVKKMSSEWHGEATFNKQIDKEGLIKARHSFVVTPPKK